MKASRLMSLLLAACFLLPACGSGEGNFSSPDPSLSPTLLPEESTPPVWPTATPTHQPTTPTTVPTSIPTRRSTQPTPTPGGVCDGRDKHAASLSDHCLLQRRGWMYQSGRREGWYVRSTGHAVIYRFHRPITLLHPDYGRCPIPSGMSAKEVVDEARKQTPSMCSH